MSENVPHGVEQWGLHGREGPGIARWLVAEGVPLERKARVEQLLRATSGRPTTGCPRRGEGRPAGWARLAVAVRRRCSYRGSVSALPPSSAISSVSPSSVLAISSPPRPRILG